MTTQQYKPSLPVETIEWTPESIKQVNATLEESSPETVLRWSFENFAPSIVLATGFGPEGIVLMHLVSQIRPETTVFYLDTDLLFAHTYELRDELVRRLGIRFKRVHSGISLPEQAFRHGDKLWERDPDTCCHIRKVIPQRQFLVNYSAWVTGIRRDQAPTRAGAKKVEWDEKFGLVKANPLADWTLKDVWAYIHANEVPYNPLHDQNYPSVGCTHCTRPVMPGEDPRAGRWAGQEKVECGLHPAEAK